MSRQQSVLRANIRLLPLMVALCGSLLLPPAAFGQYSGMGSGRHGGGKSKQSDSDSDSKPAYKPPPAPAPLTPHGGEYFRTETNYYEVVYMPLQARIYLFDNERKPLSARDVRAQLTLQLPMENAPRRIPFQYVVLPPGATEQDYVMALLDVRPLEDRETSITLEFSGLPDRKNPTASFAPYYPRFSTRPYVAKVLLTAADRDGIARQGTCPVTGAPLGSRGPVTKLYIADFPLYVAGDDCIASVKDAPERFLPQPAMQAPGR
jgi:hypothetical protein